MFIESIPGSMLSIVDIMEDRLNFVFVFFFWYLHFIAKIKKDHRSGRGFCVINTGSTQLGEHLAQPTPLPCIKRMLY